jgi:uncharacterized surface protein with fasciclin (FAS1) repeats
VRYKVAAIAAVGASVAFGMAACGSSGAGSSASGSSASPSMSGPATPSTSTVAAPFGSACSSVPSSGAGSFQGMATAPVATAASSNPVLSTLVTAVKKAGLVDTLNSASNITVFAPDNAAFAKIPAATLNGVLANKAELTKILTYHVVSGSITPSQLASGAALKTLEGTTVTPSKMGSTFEVNGASVVCGDVHTANATVYIISSVLMPKS